MPQATANRVAVLYVPETEIGVTPTPQPIFQRLRTTGDELTAGATFITSDEITENRLVSDTIQTEASSGGTISGELSYGTYDDFLAALLGSDWVVEVTEDVENLSITVEGTGANKTYTLVRTAGRFTTTTYEEGTIIHIKSHANLEDDNFYAIIGDEKTATEMKIHPFKPITAVAADSTARGLTRLSYIRNGPLDKSFTIQKHYQDLDPNVYWFFRGARVAGLELELATGSILTSVFNFEVQADSVSNDSGGQLVPRSPNNNGVLNAVNNVASILRDNNPDLEQTFFSSLSISMDNNLRRQLAIGQLDAIGIAAGRLSLTGSIEYYFNNRRLIDDFKAAREYSLNFILNDTADVATGGNTLIISMPRIKNETLSIPTTGIDTDVFASADIQALGKGAGTEAYSLQISRRSAD